MHSWCIRLNAIDIPNSVKSIGKKAFSGCYAITSIKIPNSVTIIGREVFSYCNNLNTIVVEENNLVFDSRDNCNAIIRTASNSLLIGCKSTIVPQNVNSIEPYAFYRCVKLDSISIPNNVKSIGEEAFACCESLKSISFANSELIFGAGCFSYCRSLTSIKLPEKLNSISGRLFEECTNLKEIELPNTLERIESRAFWGCKALSTLNIPNNVQVIESGVFGLNASLSTITIPKSITSIGASAFYECDNLVVVKCLAEQVPTTDADVFKGIDLTYAVLYVPSSAIIAYQYLPPWSDFGTIIPLTEELSVKTIRSEQIPIVECVQGVIKIKGIEDNVMVRIYDMEGQMIGTALSHAGQATIHTKALPLGTLVIVEIGGNRLKIMTK